MNLYSCLQEEPGAEEGKALASLASLASDLGSCGDQSHGGKEAQRTEKKSMLGVWPSSKREKVWSGKMAQQLRAPDVLAEG